MQKTSTLTLLFLALISGTTIQAVQRKYDLKIINKSLVPVLVQLAEKKNSFKAPTNYINKLIQSNKETHVDVISGPNTLNCITLYSQNESKDILHSIYQDYIAPSKICTMTILSIKNNQSIHPYAPVYLPYHFTVTKQERT